MTLEDVNGYTLSNLGTVNVLLGKNGSGKSTALRQVEQRLHRQEEFHVRYVNPERGGHLQYQANQAERVRSNPDRLHSDRRGNQHTNFREQVVGEYNRLEVLTLRELEQVAKETPQSISNADSFNVVIDKINRLLTHVEIVRGDLGFDIQDAETGEDISSQNISSGESEIISLAIDTLVFSKDTKDDNTSILFLDEPDLHLHPDLQNRFASFVYNLSHENNFLVIIATHSTALLGGLAQNESLRMALMTKGRKEIQFRDVTDVQRKTVPVFGAHPLSEVYTNRPILLVEGDDDRRIWQQAVRSSEGRISVHPCEVGGLPNFSDFEHEVNDLLGAVYDDATAYSIRDRDHEPEELDDFENVVRYRLSCKSAENLLLTQEALAVLNTDWPTLRQKIEEWLVSFEDHERWEEMKAFRESGFDRRSHDLKKIRNVLVGITGSKKPWEVAVGQAIANTDPSEGNGHSIVDYLGNAAFESLVSN